MKILRTIHAGYGFSVFLIFFLVFLIPLMVPIFFPSRFRWTGVINRMWAKLTLIFCFLPYQVECRSALDPARKYMFCPNHFSFLDIPTMGLNPINTVFVGKNEMGSLPLFGWMYRKLHITVDRSKLRSKYETILNSRTAIEEGKSLVIYPEGGIYTLDPPEMARFKDGAFRLAIEKQIPVVPVSIPNNWIILPVNKFQVILGTVKVIFHEPIETRGLSMSDINTLKDQVFRVIKNELNTYGNQSEPAG